ncbi:class I SAM-dependent methyltransferase [Anditalea andensis]|nr:class I SAM-dependent methyltransferase [Anditalea andensis]
MNPDFYKIVKHYEDCFEKYGDSHLGVDWPKYEDVDKRYNVMVDLIRLDVPSSLEATLLDFGCGTAQLYSYILDNGVSNIKYSGLDISEKFVNHCRSKFQQNEFFLCDILDDNCQLPLFDYWVMNGVFTEKRELTFDEMWDYFKKMVIKAFSLTKRGIAFNLMSKNVDWEREDLFHVSLDQLSAFLCEEVSRDFIIRNDYGLYEYTTYLYKK